MYQHIKNIRNHEKIIFCLIPILFIIFPLYSSAKSGSDITDLWITFDDNSGNKRSIILISENDGKLYGRITKVFYKPGDETKCVNCKGEKHNQDIVGLEIFSGLTFDGNVWQGGTILDPENGKEYDCKLWLEGDSLKVRGYIMLFYRTQTWKRITESTL